MLLFALLLYLCLLIIIRTKIKLYYWNSITCDSTRYPPEYLIHHKFSVRIYGLITSPPGPERKLNILVYNDGYLAVANGKWEANNMAHESQVSTNRSLRLSEWEHYDEVMPTLVDMTTRIL